MTLAWPGHGTNWNEQQILRFAKDDNSSRELAVFAIEQVFHGCAASFVEGALFGGVDGAA